MSAGGASCVPLPGPGHCGRPHCLRAQAPFPRAGWWSLHCSARRAAGCAVKPWSPGSPGHGGRTRGAGGEPVWGQPVPGAPSPCPMRVPKPVPGDQLPQPVASGALQAVTCMSLWPWVLGTAGPTGGWHGAGEAHALDPGAGWGAFCQAGEAALAPGDPGEPAGQPAECAPVPPSRGRARPPGTELPGLLSASQGLPSEGGRAQVWGTRRLREGGLLPGT